MSKAKTTSKTVLYCRAHDAFWDGKKLVNDISKALDYSKTNFYKANNREGSVILDREKQLAEESIGEKLEYKAYIFVSWENAFENKITGKTGLNKEKISHIITVIILVIFIGIVVVLPIGWILSRIFG